MSANEAAPADAWPQRFGEGRTLERSVRWAEAEALYRQLLRETPDHKGAHLQLANVCHHQGRSGEALDLLDRLLELDTPAGPGPGQPGGDPAAAG